jgi:hypothetical protein
VINTVDDKIRGANTVDDKIRGTQSTQVRGRNIRVNRQRRHGGINTTNEQLPEHPSSPRFCGWGGGSCFSICNFLRSTLLIFICPVSFGLCVFCPLIYGF